MVCTILRENEKNKSTGVKEVDDLLIELREKTKEDWQIICREYEIKDGFFKKKIVKYYSLYVHVGGMFPYQVINFYRSYTNTSLNHNNSLELIVAYILGQLSRIDQ